MLNSNGCNLPIYYYKWKGMDFLVSQPIQMAPPLQAIELIHPNRKYRLLLFWENPNNFGIKRKTNRVHIMIFRLGSIAKRDFNAGVYCPKRIDRKCEVFLWGQTQRVKGTPQK